MYCVDHTLNLVSAHEKKQSNIKLRFLLDPKSCTNTNSISPSSSWFNNGLKRVDDVKMFMHSWEWLSNVTGRRRLKLRTRLEVLALDFKQRALKARRSLSDCTFFPCEKGRRRVYENRYSERRTPAPRGGVPFAFKDSMIHWILQFALRIAFRCVLHRYENQDIRC